jgi:phosphoserine aminotransferase
MPKLFRLTKGGKLVEGVFEGETINTPSMLAVEDALDGLKWAERIGGGKALIQRTDANFAAIARWVASSDWADFLARRADTRSTTSVCLRFKDAWFNARPAAARNSHLGRRHGRDLRHQRADAMARLGLRQCARRRRQRLTRVRPFGRRPVGSNRFSFF